MNIIKRLYNRAAEEIRMVMDDFAEGYVKIDTDLMDLVLVGVLVTTFAVLLFNFVGAPMGDIAL